MADRIDLPIACSLEGRALEQRADDWAALLKNATGRREIRGGLEIVLPDARARAKLQSLIDQERECCPWMSMEIAQTDDGLTLAISSPDPIGEGQIHAWFD